MSGREIATRIMAAWTDGNIREAVRMWNVMYDTPMSCDERSSALASVTNEAVFGITDALRAEWYRRTFN